MKKIDTQGILFIEPLNGSSQWYWGMDYTSGDLYEAEELYRDGHPVSQNKLVFVRYPDGKAVQPVVPQKGQYLGRPICYDGKIVLLLVDFPAETIQIIQFDDALERSELVAELPLSIAEDCYNLLLKTSPLMLTRQGHHDRFQILWPERVELEMGPREAFLFREGKKLYFSSWNEEPEYQEEVLVRSMDTGEIVERIPGTLMMMPDGQRWILT